MFYYVCYIDMSGSKFILPKNCEICGTQFNAKLCIQSFGKDNYFNTALSMVKILVQHAAYVFQQLPSEAIATVFRRTLEGVL